MQESCYNTCKTIIKKQKGRDTFGRHRNKWEENNVKVNVPSAVPFEWGNWIGCSLGYKFLKAANRKMYFSCPCIFV
jgi:hypothetical protein